MAKRQERVLLAELQAADPEAYKERTPAEALLAATKSADLVAQKLESELARLGISEPGLLNVFGDWISKVGTVAKAAIETDAEGRVKASKEQWNAEVMGAVMAFAFELLAAAGLTYAQRDAVRAVLLAVRTRTAHRTILTRTAEDLHDVPAFDTPSPLPMPEIVGDGRT